MKTNCLWITGLLVAAALFMSCSGKETEEQKVQKDGKAFVQNLTQGNYQEALAAMDTTMANAMPAERLDGAMQSLYRQFGELKGLRDTVRTGKIDTFNVAYVTMEFTQMAIDAKVAFNPQGQVVDVSFVPAPVAVTYETPDYVDDTAFSVYDVRFGDTAFQISGEVLVPKGDGPFPGVVLVQGIGPADRDETIGVEKPFRDIAEGLASMGIAVLRYDKRTFTHGDKFRQLPNYTVKEEVIDDAVSGFNTLRDRIKVDSSQVFILGHGLGGMLIPRIAEQTPDAAGYIILAGPTRPVEDLIYDQTKYMYSLDDSVTVEEMQSLADLKASANIVKRLTPGSGANPRDLPMGLRPSYWLDLKNYNPPEAAKAIKKPMLILQGERDFQVTMKDYAKWEEVLGDKQNVTLESYPDLNHLFIAGEGKSRPDEYYQPGHVAGYLVDYVAGWIKKN